MVPLCSPMFLIGCTGYLLNPAIGSPDPERQLSDNIPRYDGNTGWERTIISGGGRRSSVTIYGPFVSIPRGGTGKARILQNTRMAMYQDAKIADSTRPAVFLDRDGIINRKMAEGEYVTHWSGFTFLPGVFEAIRLFNANDRLVIVVTNQQCIGKGLVAMETIETIHMRMTRSLEENGSHVDGIYVCHHRASDGCSCRKPGTGLFEMALKDFRRRGIHIDMSNSYMIGDSATDILAGERAGLRTILLTSNYHPAACPDGAGLLDAARRIVGDTRARRMAM